MKTLDLDPGLDVLGENCYWCWDIFSGRAWKGLSSLPACQCGHQPEEHTSEHPHKCAHHWVDGEAKGDENLPLWRGRLERVFCVCEQYVPDYGLTRDEVIANLSKIMEMTS